MEDSFETLARQWRLQVPIPVGKAQQKLSQAIICGDHALASWIDWAAQSENIEGPEHEIADLRDRLDDVMKPHPSEGYEM